MIAGHKTYFFPVIIMNYGVDEDVIEEGVTSKDTQFWVHLGL